MTESNEKYFQDCLKLSKSAAEKRAKAFEVALENRKFEIELYWKRASYFYTMMASAFAAFFLILNAENISMIDKNFYAFTVAMIGFVFTFAWLLANKGSKQWQENWENHVNALEDDVIGSLFKTKLKRNDKHANRIEKYITAPAEISVSKLNQITVFFILIIWVFLAASITVVDCNSLRAMFQGLNLWKHEALIAITIGTCVLMVKFSKTYVGDHHSVATTKEAIVTVETKVPEPQPNDTQS